ncbi:hypothetical protein PIB30_029940 [Stylosanthes scabra]|uniref:Uncharacterized protein n=1 Tax=Stylosanthes scabra TaxID=79078 RepID=A0ABU6VBJ1_9FABA|nr:hypothetical protein [Stylosanthes scabra]
MIVNNVKRHLMNLLPIVLLALSIRIFAPFRPPRDKSSALSVSIENCYPLDRCPNHSNQAEVDNIDTENDDYVLNADKTASFDDHIDNLFVNHNVEQQNK